MTRTFQRVRRRPGGSVAASEHDANRNLEEELSTGLGGLLGANFIEGVKVKDKDVLTVRHGLSYANGRPRPWRGFICTSHHAGMTAVKGARDRERVLTLRITQLWSLVDAHTVWPDDVTTVTFSDLDGDTDEIYRFDIAWGTESGTATYLQMIPSTSGTAWTGDKTAQIRIDDGAATFFENATPRCSDPVSYSDHIGYVTGQFYARQKRWTAGTYDMRNTVWSHMYHDGTDPRYAAGQLNFVDSGNVDEINFTASVANNIKNGSHFRLYKLGLRGETLDLLVF